MKRILAKIVFSMLLINSVPMQMHCEPINSTWGDTFKTGARIGLQALQNGTRIALQSIGQNPGWTSLIGAGVLCNIAAIGWYKYKSGLSKTILAELLASKKKASQENNNDPLQKIEVPTEPGSQFEKANDVNEHENNENTNEEKDLRAEIHERYWKTIQMCSGITLMTAAFAGIGSYFSKACGYVGSKI